MQSPGNIESHDQQANAPKEGAEGEDQTTHLQATSLMHATPCASPDKGNRKKPQNPQ